MSLTPHNTPITVRDKHLYVVACVMLDNPRTYIYIYYAVRGGWGYILMFPWEVDIGHAAAKTIQLILPDTCP